MKDIQGFLQRLTNQFDAPSLYQQEEAIDPSSVAADPCLCKSDISLTELSGTATINNTVFKTNLNKNQFVEFLIRICPLCRDVRDDQLEFNFNGTQVDGPNTVSITLSSQNITSVECDPPKYIGTGTLSYAVNGASVPTRGSGTLTVTLEQVGTGPNCVYKALLVVGNLSKILTVTIETTITCIFPIPCPDAQ